MEKFAGRPTLNPEDRRDKTIGISVTQQQYEDLKTLSEMDRDYMGKIVYNIVKRYLDDNQKSIQLYRESQQARKRV